MKNILIFISCIGLTIAVMAGCASPPAAIPTVAPSPDPTSTPDPGLTARITEEKTQIIPFWAYHTYQELEKDREYMEQYTFLADRKGAVLKDLIAWGEALPASEAAREMILARASAGFEAYAKALSGNPGFTERNLAEFKRRLSESKFWGITRLDDYWTKREYSDPQGRLVKTEFEYSVLITIPRHSVDAAIADILETMYRAAPSSADQAVLDDMKTRLIF
jgi:hypothetical protein